MNTEQIYATPAKQFPLRLEHELATELDRCAKDMNTTKTAISRMAIKKLLAELKKSGAQDYMRELAV
jgi:predicted transcriptional regulator